MMYQDTDKKISMVLSTEDSINKIWLKACILYSALYGSISLNL